MRRRLQVLGRLSLVLIALLALRLFQLQIVQGARYSRLSDRNRIRKINLPAPRGRIFDRNGALLAGTRPSFTVSVIPTEMSDSTIPVLAALLELPADDLAALVQPVSYLSVPVAVRRNLSPQQLYRVEENRYRLAGVRVSVDPVRYYPEGEVFCHVIGHLGEVTADDLQRDTSYRRLDFIGRDGVERLYEANLRGRDGYEYIEVDALGQEIAPLSEKRRVEPASGSDLYLTLDARLQHEAAELLKPHRRGAVVMLDVRTGEVLCLYSRPGFDPGIFTAALTRQRWDSIIGSPDKPLFNRAIGATYPPGSVFKAFVALAALEQGRVASGTRFSPCLGAYRYGDRSFACWSRHGSQNLTEALAHSCNVYFYQLGLEIGLDSLTAFVASFPFGHRTGIDLPNEAGGILPDRAWLNRRYGAGRWGHGILLNLAIGQGELTATPLQVAVAMSALAREGRYNRPFVMAGTDSLGKASRQALAPAARTRGSRHSFQAVKTGLERVVEYGTARIARLADVTIAGKTGTAENPRGEDHAWFACYAPAETPEVAVAVLVEHGGHGGAVAAPIARQLIRRWSSHRASRPQSQAVR